MFFAVLLAGPGIRAADTNCTALFFPDNIPDCERDNEYQNYNRNECSQIHNNSLLSIKCCKYNFKQCFYYYNYYIYYVIMLWRPA